MLDTAGGVGTAVGDSESFEFWREFFTSLKVRGLSGVQLVTSDAYEDFERFCGATVHEYVVAAVPGACVMRNLHGAVSAKQAPVVTAAVKTIFAHTEPEDIHAQWDQVADTLESFVSEGRGDDAGGQSRCVGVQRVP
ncbi:putative transposase [Gordonia rhizosphera NBRC 16068]|uniref:Mutator family transposase n=1 Tax=Gordonia rhizosphera NBRC 16068 TaxID=1108045 RepID=K6WAY8_9ACTN|nr:putative transposase [Gordonia rhizosphera NBRC 16068]